MAGDTGSVANWVAVVLLVTYYNAHQRVEKMAAMLLPVSEF